VVLGTATRDFEYFESGENQMGFLFLRAFKWKYPNVQVVYTNGGGIRRRFFKGPITYGDLYEVHPFDNYVAVVKMTGKQLRSLVEVGTSGSSMLPAVSGIKIKYNTAEKPEFERDLDRDGKKEKWERNRLLSLTWTDGRPVKDDETILLATNDYLASGGDNTALVFDSIPARDKKFSDQTGRDVVADYMKAHPGMEFPTKDELNVSYEGPSHGPDIH
jgi:2',3'-cyclic-nucleotide 2'-phosphodiesterase/3'-nucleotidase